MIDLTDGREGRLILRFAIPMFIANIFQQLYNIIDSVIVGQVISKDALAEVGASFPIIYALIALVIGLGSGGTVVVSQYFGAKNIEKVKRSIDTIFLFLIVASVLTSILGIIFSESLFKLLQLPEELIPNASSYLKIYLGGMLVFFGFSGTSSILRGMGDSRTPLKFLVGTTILNVILDLLFIIVFKWGIEGAAWATVASQTVGLIAITVYLHRTHDIMKFRLFNLNFDWSIFKDIVKIGLPTGFQQTFVALGMMALLGIVNTFGTDVIAAYSVAGRIDAMASMPAMAFSAALATFVGQNIGAGKLDRVKKGLIATIKMSTIYCLFITAVAVIFGHYLMMMFTDDENVISIGYEYLIIVSSFYLLFNMMFMYTGVLRGAGATLIPMFITLISLWFIRIPIAYFLSDHIGESGIWWAIPIAWFVGMVGSYIYYLTGKWKNKGVVKTQKA
jgi:putative MATE family efflux protein